MKRGHNASLLVGLTLIALGTALNRANAASPLQEISVPDLIGLTVPEAARIAGEAGLRFDGETAEAWSQSAQVKPNQVSKQEPAAGAKVSSGSPIKVTVLRVYIAVLTFGETGLTITNIGPAPLDLSEVAFDSNQTQGNPS